MAQSDQAKSNAPIETSEADAIMVLLQQNARGKPAPTARRHVRKKWVIELQIKIEEAAAVDAVARDLAVTTQDLSRGGFSFLCRHFLYPGTQVEAQIPSLPGSPVLKGVVANCSYAENGQHRVGIKLTQIQS